MKVLIVEDEELAGERLKDLVLAYDPEITIMDILDTVSGTVSFLRKQHQSVDLIFLDIQLADGKSFEIFQQFNVLIPVIFTTAYDEFALQAFELNSIDYLMKPISQDKLNNALDKYAKITPGNATSTVIDDSIIEKLLKKKPYKERFLVRSGNKLMYLHTSQIRCFIADDKLCFIVHKENDKQFLIDHTLDELEKLLDPDSFFRINRSVMINITEIKELKKYPGKRLIILSESKFSSKFVVSRNRTSSLKEWLNNK